MTNTRRSCAAVVLALVFSLTALGGDMYGGIAPPDPAPTTSAAATAATKPTGTSDAAQQPAANDLSTATLAEAAAQFLSLVLTIL